MAAYVFGYGSLIDSQSRLGSVPESTLAHPVVLDGYERTWNVPSSGLRFRTTFLGLTEKQGAMCEGVLFSISDSGMAALDQRERIYEKQQVDPDLFTGLDDANYKNGVPIFTYLFDSAHKPNPETPIIQSYVDICLSGCLAIDQSRGASDYVFTRTFVRTTKRWSTHWVNDRIYPRAPWRTVPQARIIDQILSEEVPDEFGSIVLDR